MMENIPDAPDIRHAMETGYAPWVDNREPRCPVCGESCDTIYRNAEGDIVGCNECLTAYDAWEELADV